MQCGTISGSSSQQSYQCLDITSQRIIEILSEQNMLVYITTLGMSLVLEKMWFYCFNLVLFMIARLDVTLYVKK